MYYANMNSKWLIQVFNVHVTALLPATNLKENPQNLLHIYTLPSSVCTLTNSIQALCQCCGSTAGCDVMLIQFLLVARIHFNLSISAWTCNFESRLRAVRFVILQRKPASTTSALLFKEGYLNPFQPSLLKVHRYHCVLNKSTRIAACARINQMQWWGRREWVQLLWWRRVFCISSSEFCC